jgi:hypothetical protein
MANPDCPVCRKEMEAVEPPLMGKEQLTALMQSRVRVYICQTDNCEFKGIPRYFKK